MKHFISCLLLLFLCYNESIGQNQKWPLKKTLKAEFDILTIPVMNFSPDGEILAYGASKGKLGLYAESAGEPQLIDIGSDAHIIATVFNAAGNKLVIGTKDGEIMFINVADKSITKKFKAHDKSVLFLLFAKDGTLYSSGRDNKIKTWNENGEVQKTFETKGNPNTIQLRDDRLIYMSGKGVLGVFDITTGNLISSDGLSLAERADVSPSGVYAVAVGLSKQVNVWYIEGREYTKALSGQCNDVRYSPDGELLATAQKDGTVEIRRTSDWGITGSLSHGDEVYSIAFSPDGSSLASLDEDYVLNIWGRKILNRASLPKFTTNKLPVDKIVGYGYIDKTGKVLNYGYDFAPAEFEDGFAKIDVAGGTMLMDTLGNILAEPNGNINFPGLQKFQDGLAIFDNGYIDKKGNHVIKCLGEKTPFIDGRAAIYDQGGWYYIDKKGKRFWEISDGTRKVKYVMNLGHGMFMTGGFDHVHINDIHKMSGTWKIDADLAFDLFRGVSKASTFKDGVMFLYPSTKYVTLMDTTGAKLLKHSIAFDWRDVLEDGRLKPTAKAWDEVKAGNLIVPGKEAMVNPLFAVTTDVSKPETKKPITNLPAKIKTLAPDSMIYALGEGVYFIRKNQETGYLVNDKGVSLGIDIGREGFGPCISQIGQFHHGLARIYATIKEPPKVYTAEELEQQRLAAVAEEKRRAEEEAKYASDLDKYLNGVKCEECSGTGQVDVSPLIQHTNSFGTVVKTTYSKYAQMKPCRRCQGKGRVKY
jgi:WD40 repeat protein